MRYNRYKKTYKSTAKKLRLEGNQKCHRLKTEIRPPRLPKLPSFDCQSKFFPTSPVIKGEVTGTIYGLFSTANPERIEYVGATAGNPLRRLYGHKCGANSKKVFDWITGLKNNGQDVGMEILETYPYPELSPAEAAWTIFYQEQGQATLNSGIRSSHIRSTYLQLSV